MGSKLRTQMIIVLITVVNAAVPELPAYNRELTR